MRILALIAARSGSKGLRHKNVRKFHGTPLLVRAIDLALRSRRRRETWSIIVSTNSPHYARLARGAGAEVILRPPALARDTTPLRDVVRHTLQEVDAARQFDAVLMLSATTPLTTVPDVRRALDLFARDPRASVASVVDDRTSESHRFGLCGDRLVGRPRKVGRRQEDTSVVLNGALYVASPAWLARHGQFVVVGKTRPLNMPPERSVDIDTALDLRWAEFLATHG